MVQTRITGKQIGDGTVGVDLTVDVTGTLPAGNGGTGQASLTSLPLTTPQITTDIKDTNGVRILRLDPTVSAVNYLYISNRIAGDSPVLGADGTSTNIDIVFVPKNAGGFRCYSTDPFIQADGPATDQDLRFITKGAGRVKHGTVNIPTISSTDTLTNKTLTNPTVNSYVEGVVVIGNTSTAKTIDLTSGTVQTATLTGNCTFTMPTATAGKSFVLLLSTGAGSFTATFTGVKWASSGAPTITVAASKLDFLSFFADGTNWYGSYMQGYTP